MEVQGRRARVLLIDLGASSGGVEAYLEALAKILAEQADLYALCTMTEVAERLERCGVRVWRVPLFRRARIFRFVTAALVMAYVLLRHEIDIVQINGFLESILLLPARLLGRKTVYTRHGPFEIDLFPWYRKPFKFMPRVLSRYGAHLASRLVCVSETVGSLYTPLFPKGRVAVIPNWVTTLPTPQARVATSNRTTHIVCIGRLEQYKGVQLLIEAVRGLKSITLTVVGDGAYRPELEALSAGLAVTFTGFQTRPAAYYRQADIFVLPSLGPEGLPMVALEAMSHMLPCIFSDLPVHAEITENGRGARLFRCGDVFDLRSQIESLIEDEAACASLAKHAYHLVQSKYHEPVARQAYLQLFGSLRLRHHSLDVFQQRQST